jgi:ubiquinone/menaquinone biosynthesis C-methylase UbiE
MIGVAHAMAGAENVRNVAFEQADAKICTFAAQSLDIAISRAGTMFLGDPVAAFSNIARACARKAESPSWSGNRCRATSGWSAFGGRSLLDETFRCHRRMRPPRSR